MPSTPTGRNRFEKQGTGENTNTWGAKLNTTAIDLIDESLDGRNAFTLSGSRTLGSTNFASDEARKRFQDITGGSGGTVVIPAVEKWYVVRNNASGDAVFTAGGATNATIAPGQVQIVVCDGVNVRTDSAVTAAAASAAASAASASASAGSATAASGSAANSATSATASANSASAAATSATNAANSASAAATTAAGINDANLVHKAGAETIAGAKTFSSAITASAGITINGQTLSGLTATGKSLAEAANAAAVRSAAALVPGTDVMAFDADLAAIAGLVTSANKLPYFTGAGVAALADLSAFGRSLIDDADAATARATLGLAALASSGNALDLSGSLPIARFNGGAGASSTTYWRGDGVWATGPVTDVQDFASSGTWIKPGGSPKLVEVILWGGGGGGGPGGSTVGGGGGNGGYYSRASFLPADLAASETVTVGAGGLGGNSSTNGGTTSFGAKLIASGGERGMYGGTPLPLSGYGQVGPGAGAWGAQSGYATPHGSNYTSMNNFYAAAMCPGGGGGGYGGTTPGGDGGFGARGSASGGPQGGGGAGGATAGASGQSGLARVGAIPGTAGGGGGGSSGGVGGNGGAGGSGAGGGGGGQGGGAGGLGGAGGAGFCRVVTYF